MQGKKSTVTEKIDTFGGYDRRGDLSERSFFDMKNMSGRDHPAVTVREERGEVDLSGARVYGILTMDAMHNGEIIKNALVADCKDRIKLFFEKDGEYRCVDRFNTSSTLTHGKKRAVVQGPSVYFFPDNMCFNFMDSSVTPLGYYATFPLGVAEDGYLYDMILEPSTLEGEDADTASPYRRLRRRTFRTENGQPADTPNSYLSFSDGISDGDTLVFRGFSDNRLNREFNVVYKEKNGGFLVIEADVTLTQRSGTVIIEREIPEMDFVIASGNRLWGCKYGMTREGKCVNEIYASALGDPKNWHSFRGTAADSWTCSVGVGGAFTGAVCIDGDPVFFKEDSVIKVFGKQPSEYTLSESAVRGIESGSENSAVFVHDTLYYKTYSGIVRYDGGVPRNVDGALGGEGYKNAIAGTVDDRYFVSMENSRGVRELFVYDTVRRLWHKEEDPGIVAFSRAGGELYFLAENEESNRLFTVRHRKGTTPEGAIGWMCETGDLGYNEPCHKYVSLVGLRLESDVTTDVSLYIQYDKDGVWHSVAAFGGKNGTVQLRVRPRRCSGFRLRLEGRGKCKLISLSRKLETCSLTGSDGR